MTAQILIADHDPVVREQCSRFLTSGGYDVAVAADGLQCLEQLRAGCPDLLVLDPDVLWGGWGVLEWLESEQSPKPVKVVLADGHSTKPFPDKICRMTTARLERPAGLAQMADFVRDLKRILADDSPCAIPVGDRNLIAAQET